MAYSDPASSSVKKVSEKVVTSTASLVTTPNFYELEAALVYHVITNIDDPIIDQELTKNNVDNPDDPLVRHKYIGAVQCRPLNDKSYSSTAVEILPIAFPEIANDGNYPVVNEIVIFGEYDRFDQERSGRFYRRLNKFNKINHNADLATRARFPEDESTSANDRNNSSAGISKTSGASKKQNESLGEYFKPDDKIHPLQIYEGDRLIQSRFGQSIRLGAHNPILDDIENSNPYIIIRNRENQRTKDNIQIGSMINEDLSGDGTSNNSGDGSSIWMTSGLIDVPFVRPTKTEINAFIKSGTDYPHNLKQDRITINSGGLIISARDQHLIFHSRKQTGFISDDILSIDTGKGVYVNTNETNFEVETKNFTIEMIPKVSGRIYLGSKGDGKNDATNLEPIILGNALEQFLNDVLDVLKNHTHPSPTGPTGIPTESLKFQVFQSQLHRLKSRTVFTKPNG